MFTLQLALQEAEQDAWHTTTCSTVLCSHSVIFCYNTIMSDCASLSSFYRLTIVIWRLIIYWLSKLTVIWHCSSSDERSVAWITVLFNDSWHSLSEIWILTIVVYEILISILSSTITYVRLTIVLLFSWFNYWHAVNCSFKDSIVVWYMLI
jgi:hypothetical protein